MSKPSAIVDQAGARHQPPCALTAEEVFLLLRAYTADKTCITEADALTLCHWAPRTICRVCLALKKETIGKETSGTREHIEKETPGIICIIWSMAR